MVVVSVCRRQTVFDSILNINIYSIDKNKKVFIESNKTRIDEMFGHFIYENVFNQNENQITV